MGNCCGLTNVTKIASPNLAPTPSHFKVGSEIRCPHNHTCCENVENRKNNINQVFERKELTCTTCSTSLNETEGSFWSCLMCNYDVCSECVRCEAEIPNQIQISGRRGIKSTINGKYIESKKSHENRVLYHKENNPNYSIYWKKGDNEWKIARPFVTSTFVHNPNWIFMLPTTLQQIIMSDEKFECPRVVADIITSFVVERKVTIPVYQCTHYPDGLLKWRQQRGTDLKKKLSVSIEAQVPLSEIERLIEYQTTLFPRIIHTYVVNMDHPELIQRGGLPDETDMAEKYFQQLPDNALVGDVFAWDNAVLVNIITLGATSPDHLSDLDEMMTFYLDSMSPSEMFGEEIVSNDSYNQLGYANEYAI